MLTLSRVAIKTNRDRHQSTSTISLSVLRQVGSSHLLHRLPRTDVLNRLCWYVADRYCAELRNLRAFRPRSNSLHSIRPPQRVSEGVFALAQFLLQQITIMEDPDAEDKRRKLIYDRVPSETVKDPSGLARELLWRAQREVPHLSTADTTGVGSSMNKSEINGKKGKSLVMLPPKSKSRVWNFTPPYVPIWLPLPLRSADGRRIDNGSSKIIR